jgi:hypothetical protein
MSDRPDARRAAGAATGGALGCAVFTSGGAEVNPSHVATSVNPDTTTVDFQVIRRTPHLNTAFNASPFRALGACECGAQRHGGAYVRRRAARDASSAPRVERSHDTQTGLSRRLARRFAVL